MRYFTDGDQIAIVRDDFIDLQSSPAAFFPSEIAVGDGRLLSSAARRSQARVWFVGGCCFVKETS